MNTSIKTYLEIRNKTGLNNQEYEIIQWAEDNQKEFAYKYLDYFKENNLKLKYDCRLHGWDVIDYDNENNTTFYYDYLVMQNNLSLNRISCFSVEHPNFIKFIKNNRASYSNIREVKFEHFKYYVDNVIDFNSLCPVNPNTKHNSTFIDYVVQYNDLEKIKYCYEKGLFPPGYDIKKWGFKSGPIPDDVEEFYISVGLLIDFNVHKNDEPKEININKYIERLHKKINVFEKIRDGDIDNLQLTLTQWQYLKSNEYTALMDSIY